MAEKSPFNWLKELSGIGLGAVAVLYVCGFLVHIVYYRVLGLDVGAQPLTYLTFSGDYLISVLLSAPQLFWQFGEYRQALAADHLWLIIVFSMIGLLLILSLKTRYRGKLLKSLACVFVAASCVTLVSIELQVLRTQHVLQPLSPVEVRNSGQDNANEKSKILRQQATLVKDAYEEHEKLGISLPGFREWDRWFNPLHAQVNRERFNYYLALLFLNILLLFTLGAAILLRDNGFYSKFILVEALVGVLAVLLLFPCMYATLGRVFSFPVVVLRLKIEDSKNAQQQAGARPVDGEQARKTNEGMLEAQGVLTHPVFMIFQEDSEIVVYDRLNLFQLKKIPRSQVLGISQLYEASPFDNCRFEKGEFGPCEAQWIQDSAPILNF